MQEFAPPQVLDILRSLTSSGKWRSKQFVPVDMNFAVLFFQLITYKYSPSIVSFNSPKAGAPQLCRCCA